MTVYRALRRNAPETVMAVGMTLMALGMAGTGPLVVRGPWWAAGFAAVAVWPLLRPPAGGVGRGAISHLVGGLAMVCMCSRPTMSTMGDDGTTAGSGDLAPPPGHVMAGVPASAPHGVAAAVPVSPIATLTLLEWALGCYLLLDTIVTLTPRRTSSNDPLAPPLGAWSRAVMGVGTMIMIAGR